MKYCKNKHMRKEILMKQEKKKRAVSFILSLLLMVVAVPMNPVMAGAETVDESNVSSGVCGAEGNGENVRWEYDGNGILTLSGTGAVASNALAERILPYIPGTALGYYSFRNIRIGEGITKLKSNSLSAMFGMISRIELPSTITEIASDALDELPSAVLYGKSECARKYAENWGISYVDATKTYDLSDAWFYILSCEYTGSEIRPLSVESTANMYEVSYNGVSLVQGLDYSVEYYEDNIECGEAKAVITGLGCYTGSKETSFSICEDLIAVDSSDVEITYENKPESYGEAVDTNPKTVVTYEGKTLSEGVDYVVKIERKYFNDVGECVPDGGCEPEILYMYIRVYGKGRYRMLEILCAGNQVERVFMSVWNMTGYHMTDHLKSPM